MFIFLLATIVNLALISSFVGTFIVWKRMSYLAETIAHAALLSIYIGELTGINDTLCIIIICLLVSIFTQYLINKRVTSDASLAIVGHTFLALGLVATSNSEHLHHYLLGNFELITAADIGISIATNVLAISFISYNWSGLLLSVLSSKLAQIEGVRVKTLMLGLTIISALSIASMIKVAGSLLSISLLIMPVVIATQFKVAPVKIIFISFFVSLIHLALGVAINLNFNLPIGPITVLLLGGTLALVMGLKKRHV